MASNFIRYQGKNVCSGTTSGSTADIWINFALKNTGLWRCPNVWLNEFFNYVIQKVRVPLISKTAQVFWFAFTTSLTWRDSIWEIYWEASPSVHWLHRSKKSVCSCTSKTSSMYCQRNSSAGLDCSTTIQKTEFEVWQIHSNRRKQTGHLMFTCTFRGPWYRGARVSVLTTSIVASSFVFQLSL